MIAGFASAVMDPALPVPEGLTDPQGRPAGRRFSVYRNNVAVSLTEALVTGFPVLHRLLGDAFFRAMAGVFVRAHPPQDRVLAIYGQAMPPFLSGFPPVAHLPYLPDVARLELALRAAYHAADTDPIAPTRLALPPERLMAARPVLAPSLRLLRSDWPIHGIWTANTAGGAGPDSVRAEDVLVLRPGFDPAPHLLGPGGGSFVACLAEGGTFGQAATAAGAGHDLSATIGLLLEGNAITDLTETPT